MTPMRYYWTKTKCDMQMASQLREMNKSREVEMMVPVYGPKMVRNKQRVALPDGTVPEQIEIMVEIGREPRKVTTEAMSRREVHRAAMGR